MNEKRYQKRLDFQQKIITRQSEQIETFKLEIEKLNLKLKEKDEIINSVESFRKEMAENIQEQKRLKKEHQKLIEELRKMKEIMNVPVYKGRWWLIKFLLK